MLQKRLEVVSNSNRRWFIRIEVTQEEEEKEEKEEEKEEDAETRVSQKIRTHKKGSLL